MTKELAQYLFLEETLYRTGKVPAPPRSSVPTTTKNHVWFFGEKPVGEKRELMIKLLQACQLKPQEVEFYFEPLDLSMYVAQNGHLETVVVFGSSAAQWVKGWPTYQIHTQGGLMALHTFTLDALVSNQQQEKKQFWGWLQTLYRLT